MAGIFGAGSDREQQQQRDRGINSSADSGGGGSRESAGSGNSGGMQEILDLISNRALRAQGAQSIGAPNNGGRRNALAEFVSSLDRGKGAPKYYIRTPSSSPGFISRGLSRYTSPEQYNPDPTNPFPAGFVHPNDPQYNQYYQTRDISGVPTEVRIRDPWGLPIDATDPSNPIVTHNLHPHLKPKPSSTTYTESGTLPPRDYGYLNAP